MDLTEIAPRHARFKKAVKSTGYGFINYTIQGSGIF
jgi:hypothetical protein